MQSWRGFRAWMKTTNKTRKERRVCNNEKKKKLWRKSGKCKEWQSAPWFAKPNFPWSTKIARANQKEPNLRPKESQRILRTATKSSFYSQRKTRKTSHRRRFSSCFRSIARSAKASSSQNRSKITVISFDSTCIVRIIAMPWDQSRKLKIEKIGTIKWSYTVISSCKKNQKRR